MLVLPIQCGQAGLDPDSSFENAGQTCTNAVSSFLGTPVHPSAAAVGTVVGLLVTIAVFLVTLYVDNQRKGGSQ